MQKHTQTENDKKRRSASPGFVDSMLGGGKRPQRPDVKGVVTSGAGAPRHGDKGV